VPSRKAAASRMLRCTVGGRSGSDCAMLAPDKHDRLTSDSCGITASQNAAGLARREQKCRLHEVSNYRGQRKS
jgi:hypothetical protein